MSPAEIPLLAFKWEKVTGSSENIFHDGLTMLKLFPIFHPQQ